MTILAQTLWIPDVGELSTYLLFVATVLLATFGATTWLTHKQRSFRGRSPLFDLLVPWMPVVQIGLWAMVFLLIVFVLTTASNETAAWILIPGLLAMVIASRDIVRNAFAGVLVALEHSMLAGDAIQVSTDRGEVRGVIVSIGLRRTTLESGDGNEIHLPNSILLNSTVKTTRAHGADSAIELELRVPARAEDFGDHEFVEEWKTWLRRAAAVSKYASTRRAPRVFVKGFEDDALVLEIQAQALNPDFERHLQGDLHEMLREKLATHPDQKKLVDDR